MTEGVIKTIHLTKSKQPQHRRGDHWSSVTPKRTLARVSFLLYKFILQKLMEKFLPLCYTKNSQTKLNIKKCVTKGDILSFFRHTPITAICKNCKFQMGVFTHFYLVLFGDNRDLRFSAATSVGALFYFKGVRLYTKECFQSGKC